LTGTLVVDTSVVYGALDPSDADHVRCTSALSSGAVVVMPAPVIVEIDWLARSRGCAGAMTALLSSVLDNSLLIVNLDVEDVARATQLVEQYDDLPLELVDASVIAIAERLEQDTIATLDRRHFSVIRPLHIDAFTLVP
jgi:predicted nucleic acid-binding protein